MTDWMEQAACKGMDPAFWYPGKDEAGHPTKHNSPAKDTCRGCPVRQECLEYALDNCEVHGIWGGMSERQRKRLRGERRAVSKCGTEAGYRRHRYYGQPQCGECLAAHAQHNASTAPVRAMMFAAIGKPNSKYNRNRAKGWCSRCSAGNHANCVGCLCQCRAA